MNRRFGPYEVVSLLGEGGMGTVYAARDDRLGRMVAIKTLRAAHANDESKQRLWREARAAAGISHPNICQVYDVGEAEGDLYIAMELLEGEPLAERLGEGAVPPSEAVEVMLGILAALEALHRRSLIHRDLKPSNIFLTEHGVKLLDFGLTRAVIGTGEHTEAALTQPGVAVGTPRYMAPEQWAGSEVGPPADVFAAGALLFEMLTGGPAFPGNTMVEILHAVVHGEPPALAGGPEVMALDAVIQRAMAKRPADRYPEAGAMARGLRDAMNALGPAAALPMRAMKRLVVLPFRLLRPDDEISFLSLGLADAVSMSLSGIESLIVRSSATAARYQTDIPDLKAIAVDASVDVVVFGTLLRAGDQVRVTAQLVEAPAGTVLGSSSAQGRLEDLFQLQDDLAGKIVDALALPLRERRAPAPGSSPTRNPEAYELYLRANQIAGVRRQLSMARDLYRRAVILDPAFASAWARLGRVYRVMSKYNQDGNPEENLALAQEAFRKSLDLNPDLPTAHHYYTYMEVEELGRSVESMVRLLDQARKRAADPEIFSALVLACRFCGLLDASLAADRRARRLDPGIRTSVMYTYWMVGDYENAIHYDDEDVPYARNYGLISLGRIEEALAGLRAVEESRPPGLEYDLMRCTRAALEGNREECLRAAETLRDSSFRDPEGILFLALNMAQVGAVEETLGTLEQVVRGGYYCPDLLEQDPRFAVMRGEPRFVECARLAAEGRDRAARAYEAAGGRELLGAGTAR